MFNEMRSGKPEGRGNMYPIVSNTYLFGKAASLFTYHQAKGRA